MTDNREEGVCERCDRKYPVWFAPNDLWNAVMRASGSDLWQFVCLDCFTLFAEATGHTTTAWVLTTEEKFNEAHLYKTVDQVTAILEKYITKGSQEKQS